MNQLSNLNPKFMKSREEDKIDNFMIGTIIISETIKIDTDQIVETGKISIDKKEVDLGMKKNMREEILEAKIHEYTKILGDRTVEENTETIIGIKITPAIEVGTGLEKDHFQEI